MFIILIVLLLLLKYCCVFSRWLMKQKCGSNTIAWKSSAALTLPTRLTAMMIAATPEAAAMDVPTTGTTGQQEQTTCRPATATSALTWMTQRRGGATLLRRRAHTGWGSWRSSSHLTLTGLYLLCAFPLSVCVSACVCVCVCVRERENERERERERESLTQHHKHGPMLWLCSCSFDSSGIYVENLENFVTL